MTHFNFSTQIVGPFPYSTTEKNNLYKVDEISEEGLNKTFGLLFILSKNVFLYIQVRERKQTPNNGKPINSWLCLGFKVNNITN